jgi:hypothetical protein
MRGGVKIMQVLQVKEYNNLMSSKYDEDCKKWDYTTGGFPQIAFYQFFKPNGSDRLTGYVAFNERKAILRSTKREAIQAFEK